MKKVFLLLFVLGCASTAFGAERNIVPNGGFENSYFMQNLFDGVDAQGRVRVFTSDLNDVIYREGTTETRPLFACQPQFIDVNEDGLKDLVVASPSGWAFVYFNKGEKGAPSFPDGGYPIKTWLGRVPRIHAVDYDGDNHPDLLFGTKDGQLYWLPNHNRKNADTFILSPGKPRFCWPNLIQQGFELKPIMAGSEPICVGTYAAPFYADFNGDGKPDLIVGEGQYSANSVRIYLNQGSAGQPRFGNQQGKDWFYLAYGDGREQLVPALYDWDGDGKPDLLVGDYDGHINLYLNNRTANSRPDEIEPLAWSKLITAGDQDSFGPLVAFCPCDWNDDGIPDLLIGTTTGMVQVALGRGTRTDPRLGTPTYIASRDRETDRRTPAGWDHDVVFADTSNGIYYPESISKEEDPSLTFPPGAEADDKRVLRFAYADNYAGYTRAPKFMSGAFMEGGFNVRSVLSTVERGKNYEISFWYKGDRMRIGLEMDFTEKFLPRENRPAVNYPVSVAVSAGPNWNKFSKKIKMPGSKGKKLTSAPIRFYFVGDGVAYLDDVKLIELPY